MNSPLGDEGEIEIRRLASSDLPGMLALVRELRPHVDMAMLEERFAASTELGYEMHVAFRDGTPVALAGFRPVITLSRGRYLHLDDLVVAANAQREGIGRLLIAHVEAEAMQHGHSSVFLDARPSAIPFYTKCAYVPHTSPSYWKPLKKT